GEQQHRPLELGRNLADDVDRLGLERPQMAELVLPRLDLGSGSHCYPIILVNLTMFMNIASIRPVQCELSIRSVQHLMGGYRCPLSCLTLDHNRCLGAESSPTCESMIARTVRRQRPHWEPAPQAEATCRDVDAPPSIASRTASVVMPRHRQTYIGSHPHH